MNSNFPPAPDTGAGYPSHDGWPGPGDYRGISRYKRLSGDPSWRLVEYNTLSSDVALKNTWTHHRFYGDGAVYVDVTEPEIIFAGLSSDRYGSRVVKAMWRWRFVRFIKRYVLRMDLDD